MLDVLSIIETRRDGHEHAQQELEFLAQAAAKNTVPDYQLAAWLMAAYLKPLTEKETTELTIAMANTGERIDLTGLPKPWVDKHSTGGVGDKTTLVVLPILAACGLTVVKMSGRGLGITGGTVDKLESIPGFRMNLSPEEMKAQAAKIGIAITGQSPNLAPADKTLYALRDATATTESIPLIASSILSKKIAGGCQYLSLDVKCGSGAFMKTQERATELAQWLRNIGEQAGLKVHATITDMDQPLGAFIGNILEVREAEVVLGWKDGTKAIPTTERFKELCLTLAGETLHFVGKAATKGAGIAQAKEALASGRAHQKFEEWCIAQGASPNFAHEMYMNDAPQRLDILAPSTGYIAEINAGIVGETVVDLGGGRKTKDDKIDPLVGIHSAICVGDRVEKGDFMVAIYAATTEAAEAAKQSLKPAIRISETPVPARPVILAMTGPRATVSQH